MPALDRRHALVRHPHHGRIAAARRHGHSAGHVTPLPERTRWSSGRPARSRVGAATAYDPIIGAAAARSAYNVDGTGMTVAVIDTGVDYNNSALGGGFGPATRSSPATTSPTAPAIRMATASQHGTAIAGLIGSSDPNDLGVAPGVKIVALRVTDSTTPPA